MRRGAAAALLAVAVPLTAVSTAGAAPSAAAKLAATAKKSPNQTVTAIVQFTVSEAKAKQIVKAHKGKITDKLPAVQGFAVKLPAKHAKSLKRAKGVLNVTLNSKVKSTSFSPELLATNFPKTTGADQAWAAGVTGKGVGVAVIDSGINGDIPDFLGADGSSRVTSVISNPGATSAGDPVGHGTHVAGIVGGNSAFRTDGLAGKYTGIAPEADLIAIKTSDDVGESTVVDVINALQFVVDHKDELGIKVVNLSVSSDTPGSYLTDPLNAAVEFAWHAGIVVVSAAGNRGDAADAVQYAPGNDPYVISVGATDEADTPAAADDTLASFSSRGVTLDGFNKPDVVAPGARIVAPLAAGSAFAALAPATSIFDGSQYIRIGGTSMAAPVVAGAAALVLQARPDLNPDQVKELLTTHVSSTAAGGELNIPAALGAQVPGKGANQGLVPNTSVANALALSGIDPTRATWTKATWTRATWTKATWTRATWTRATWTADAAGTTAPWARATWTCAACVSEGGGVDATRSTWSRSTWSRSTWSSIEW